MYITIKLVMGDTLLRFIFLSSHTSLIVRRHPKHGGGHPISDERRCKMADSKDISKQDIQFTRLESTVGHQVALYCMCAVYDVPYYGDIYADTWQDYIESIDGGDFTAGVTDINAAVIDGMEKHERWETIWGEGYSETDYKQLDDLYRTMTAQLDATGGIDRQQEDAARTCARMALNRNKLILNYKDKDAIQTANTLDKMIRENLKDANMRKADILPSAQQRPDGFVDALKKKYGLSITEMTKDDVMQTFFNWCRSKHYPETVDAEEHAMMAILRTMQKNDDLPEPVDLPSDFNFGPYAAQFEMEPNDAEKDAYEYLGLVRGEFHASDEGGDA